MAVLEAEALPAKNASGGKFSWRARSCPAARREAQTECVRRANLNPFLVCCCSLLPSLGPSLMSPASLSRLSS